MRQHKFNSRAGWYTTDVRGPFPKNSQPGLIHLDSLLEVKYARQLELRTKSNDILGWERSYESWDFNERAPKPFRANSQIKPDFKYYENDGTPVWTEVKGYARPESLTQIRRAIKLYPERRLLIYTKSGTYDPEDYIKKFGRKR